MIGGVERHLVDPPAGTVEDAELGREAVGEPSGRAHLGAAGGGAEAGEHAGAGRGPGPRQRLAQRQVAFPEVEVAALGRLVLDGVSRKLGSSGGAGPSSSSD